MQPIHQPDHRRFIIQSDQGEAVLEYRLTGQNGINFTHTFVPEEIRSQGVAEKLVRHGLKWARDNRLNISASCWYVERFLK